MSSLQSSADALRDIFQSVCRDFEATLVEMDGAALTSGARSSRCTARRLRVEQQIGIGGRGEEVSKR